MTVFSDRMVAEIVQTFWAALQRGEFISDLGAGQGSPRSTRRLNDMDSLPPRIG